MGCSLHGSFLRSGGARTRAERPVADDDDDDGDDDALGVVVNIRTNLLVLWALSSRIRRADMHISLAPREGVNDQHHARSIHTHTIFDSLRVAIFPFFPFFLVFFSSSFLLFFFSSFPRFLLFFSSFPFFLPLPSPGVSRPPTSLDLPSNPFVCNCRVPQYSNSKKKDM